MSVSSWLRSSNHSAPAARRRNQRAGFRPRPEALEDRVLLSASAYLQTNLVGYKQGIAQSTDTNLNGWGMASLPNGDFVVANAFTTGKATFYDAAGHVLPQTITVPGSATGSAALGLGSGGHPTGVVYNPTSNFVISENGKSAPALLIFDSIDGTISGWNPAVDPNHAVLIKDTFAAGTPAVFTSLAMAQNSRGQTILYATDYLNNRVDMFDSHFNLIGSFTDPNVTSVDPNLSAWSVQAEGGKLYVTFADLHSFNAGAVDVFDTDGHLLRQFAANGPDAGPLENPWGITQAPANFGKYSGDLLIGNVAGAGNINVFNPHTGAYLGELDQPDGAPIAITGLWDLQFGSGTPWGGKTNELFFDAGPNAPGVAINGLFGVIQAAGRQGGGPVFAAAVPSQPVQQTLTGQTLSTPTAATTQASSEGSGISSDGTPTLENSGSITGNAAPGVSVAEDIENLDAVYLNSSPLIGILDRGVAQGPIEGA
jgi:uncharacterized protein (TIGR03118 family)